MSKDFLTDPLWYKDAVIYELHVRSFFDANNDGYGDFAGLRRKLPYLGSLGVNTLWLLPFLESPLRDDGYDTADYCKILPVHGSLDDFQAFLDEAHERGMRVITELVLNHTSDQHPWFQEARNPDSPKHDWYVWSETTEKYKEARIIFTDTEISNWTWDRKAGKYYWHRFFSHQPDLNYENQEVHRTMQEVLFYWLDMGVDGLRLDAVPYLYEREGTSCENLPETLHYIQGLRAAIEERYGPGKVLLAEANQWPEDTLPYFADGRGVQMAFNFPVMPRMFMSLRRESRRPLVEMLELTKDIPEECQWAIFLRNHDELTLEMVTDEERDYMYHEYAADPRFRINVGIRRRLAPLLGNERRRMELMNALLLSLKGSPVLYYGDEIAMGDDPFLGDRNGVRTPMQWSPDKNGGFSRAPQHRLFLPTIGKGPYSFEFVNVEDAEADPHSLLGFMKRILALRKQHEKVFGRGSFRVISIENQSVFAFLREYEGERILIIANFSRYAQSAFLPVTEEFYKHIPIELFSQTTFPLIEDKPYHLTLSPHGFYWFSLVPEEVHRQMYERELAAYEGEEPSDLRTIRVTDGIENLLIRTLVRDKGVETFEEVLPDFLKRQRWFGAKDSVIKKVSVEDAVRIRGGAEPVYLSLLDVVFEDRRELYTLPLTIIPADSAKELLESRGPAAVAWLATSSGRYLLHDATVNPDFWLTLFRWWQSRGRGRSLKGLYVSERREEVNHAVIESARPLTGEQSNSAAILDDKYFIKVYRRLESGTNPEPELLDYLTEAGFLFIPRLHGTITFNRPDGQFALGILQQALPVEKDGWIYALDLMERFLERISEIAVPPMRFPQSYEDPVPVWLEEVASEMLSMAGVIGVRTAQLHLALSKAERPGLAPIDPPPDEMQALIDRVRHDATVTRQTLIERHEKLDGVPQDAAWQRAHQQLSALEKLPVKAKKIRVHGDYHLGQLIRSEGELYILDFEGEPARPIQQRRQHDSALRDVAGMLRSIEYAVLAAWHEHGDGHAEMRKWASLISHWSEAVFLNGYFQTAEGADFLLPKVERQRVLWVYLLEKALYEVRYELNHRPSWSWLPLHSLGRLLQSETSIDVAQAPIRT